MSQSSEWKNCLCIAKRSGKYAIAPLRVESSQQKTYRALVLYIRTLSI
jgi:hypothetical protein